jgi:hypothetical protein
MNTSVMHEVLAESQGGRLTFPEVVRRLLEAGIESYLGDLATGQETFYTGDGKAHVEQMTLPLAPIAEEFSSSEVVSAIRGVQADTIRHPEFVKPSSS